MSEALSIGVVTSSVSRNAGGLFYSVRASARALASAGHAVSVLSLRDAATAQDIGEWAPLSPRIFEPFPPRQFGFAPKLAACLHDADHDVVHQHGLWMYPSVAVSAWRNATARPSVISPRGMLDPWALANRGWKKKLALHAFERLNLDRAACLHALNRSEAQSMRALGLTNPIAVIPNGVAPTDPEAPVPTRPDWMGGERGVILFLGRIHPKKGIMETLDAWALLKRSAPATARRWRLALAGWDDGGHLGEIARRIAALELEDDVVMPGPLYSDAKVAALAHARGFILASYSEGMPMAVLEAWAAGLPVFMSAACNLPEGFAAGAAAEIRSDPADIARVLGERLDDDSGLAAMGAAGRALVDGRFAWPVVAGQLADVYRWLTGRGDKPGCVISECTA